MINFDRQSSSLLMPISLVLFFCSFLASLDTRAQARFVEASILSSSGKVDLINGSVSGRFSLVPKYKLEPGTEIVTGDNGRVVISLTDGSQVIILPKSRVKFQDFRSANSVRELLHIIVGRVRIKIRHAAGTPN